MHPFPHVYVVNALADAAGAVSLRGAELEDILSTPPPEFDGPPGNWSPETLFMASIADCFVLSFRAIARGSRLEWKSIDCRASGTLDKTPEGACFTRIDLEVALTVPAGTDTARIERLLEKSKSSCLISNSIKPPVGIQNRIVFA